MLSFSDVGVHWMSLAELFHLMFSVTLGIVALSLILFLGLPIELCFGFYL